MVERVEKRVNAAIELHSNAARGATCFFCGSHLGADKKPRQLIKRGALTMRTGPVEFEWNGRPIALSPLESNLLAAVMWQGRVTSEELSELFPQPSRTMAVITYRIRKKFGQIGAADPLKTVRYRGISLRIEADRDGKKSTSIGAEEDLQAPA